MSQTAAIRTLGICASDFIKNRHRPPVPMQATLSVSLAANPKADSVASPANNPAEAAPDAWRKSRRPIKVGPLEELNRDAIAVTSNGVLPSPIQSRSSVSLAAL